MGTHFRCCLKRWDKRGANLLKKKKAVIFMTALIYINPLFCGIGSWLPSADSNHGHGG